MLGNMLGLNYDQIFQQVLKDKNVREHLADFMIYCFEDCIELEEVIINKFKNNKELERIIDDRIMALADKNETKTKFTRKLREKEIMKNGEV